MTAGEVTFAVLTALLSLVAVVIAVKAQATAQRSAEAADRSAAEAQRSNELAIEAADRQRFVWWIEAFSGSPGHITYVLRNDGTDTAEDVVLIPGAPVEAGMDLPQFRNLPNGTTIHGHGAHEFYCDPALAEVLPERCC